MATYHLLNPVSINGVHHKPGSLLNDNDDIAGLKAAGAALWPGTDTVMTATAVIANRARRRGADDATLMSIMMAGAATALRSGSPDLSTEPFNPVITLDHAAIQIIPAASGSIALAKGPAGHVPGVQKILYCAAGNATGIDSSAQDLNARGDAFDATQNATYFVECSQFGELMLTRKNTAPKDSVVPTISSGQIPFASANSAALIFSKAVTIPFVNGAPNLVGISLIGTAAKIVSVSGLGTTTPVFALDRAVLVGDSPSIVFGPTSLVQDMNGNLLALPKTQALTNNIANFAGLSNVMAWWKNGNLVAGTATWNDGGPNVDNLTRAGAAATFNASDAGVNNKPSMSITASITTIFNSPQIDISSATQIDILFVMRQDASPASVVMFEFGDGGANKGFGCNVQVGVLNFYLFGNVGLSWEKGSAAPLTGGFHVVRCTADLTKSTNQASMTVDGVDIGGDYTTGNAHNTAFTIAGATSIFHFGNRVATALSMPQTSAEGVVKVGVFTQAELDAVTGAWNQEFGTVVL